MAGELAWARSKSITVYRLSAAIADVSSGVVSQLFAIFEKAVQLGIYLWVYEHLRLVELSGLGAWLVAFIAFDFAYYWWHRLSHTVNLMWAAHIVHHQSEDYNLAVALRQSALTGWTSLPFYLPLALLGVPPLIFVATRAFSALYQFWIHTQLIGKLGGTVERVLNFPTHHRIHHAINAQYLDKNFGATLIIWDHMFGSYAEETVPAVYGITHPLRSFNPWWAQVHYLVELGQHASRAPRFVDKLRLLFQSPSALAPLAPLPRAAEAPQGIAPVKYAPPLTGACRRYVALQMTLLIVAATWLIFSADGLSLALDLAFASCLLLGLLALGGLLDGKRWAAPLEIARLVASAGLLLIGTLAT